MDSSAALAARAADSQVDLAWDILDHDDIELEAGPGPNGRWLRATLRGTYPATVAFSRQLSPAGGPRTFRCTCDYFRHNRLQPCGHLLAAVTAAEEQGMLDEAKGSGEPPPQSSRRAANLIAAKAAKAGKGETGRGEAGKDETARNRRKSPPPEWKNTSPPSAAR